RLWSRVTGKLLHPPCRHEDTVSAVAFSPNGRTFLTGSYDATARLWDTATGQPLGPPLRHDSHVDGVAFHPDGRTILTAGGKGLRLWDSASSKPLGPVY